MAGILMDEMEGGEERERERVVVLDDQGGGGRGRGEGDRGGNEVKFCVDDDRVDFLS
jgi:hypothetical protein